MIPPWPLRRLILAPLVMALGAGLIVLSPVLAILTVLLRLLGLGKPGGCAGCDCCGWRCSG